ncbi:collagen binding domain-containing protein [Streptococcus sp.]|uniref:MSCRAMM family protein n=1 Tax=Streptococcus sp. TaxID=1306 RepID=UPI00391B76B5
MVGLNHQSLQKEEVAAGKFILKEITPPAGYVLNETPVEVTLTADGAIRTITNKKASTSVPLAVKKELTGRTLQADEFEFVLTDQAGQVVDCEKCSRRSCDLCGFELH